jgi:hypothetical protein
LVLLTFGHLERLGLESAYGRQTLNSYIRLSVAWNRLINSTCPHAHQIKLKVTRRKDILGEFAPDENTIYISSARNAHFDTICKTLLHEMAHLHCVQNKRTGIATTAMRINVSKVHHQTHIASVIWV